MTTNRTTRRAVSCGLVAAVTLAIAGPAMASADDFEGKRISLLVPYPEGGGAALHTRFWMTLLEKYLPGNPTIVVNHVPGAGSIKGMNQFERSYKKDGLLIANTGVGTIFNQILQQKSVAYDLAKYDPIISSPTGTVYYLHKNVGIEAGDIEGLKKKSLRFPGDNPTGADALHAVVFDMLGLDIQYIWGIGTGPRRQAFERGEVDINKDFLLSYAADVKPMVDEGTAVPFMTLGIMGPNGDIVRDPMLPDVPTVVELYEKVNGKKPDGPQWNAFQMMFAGAVMTPKMLVMPGDTEPEIKAIYHAAIEKALQDPIITDTLGRSVLGDYKQNAGPGAKDIVIQAMSADAETLQWLKDFLTQKFNVSLN